LGKGGSMRLREMVYSKIHFATVTETLLHYSGSITIDKTLLDKADMLPAEKVAVLNASNGARVETYVIEGEEKSGAICVNGPAAHLFNPGDKVVIISYTWMEEEHARDWEPTIVVVDDKNRPLGSPGSGN